jgi:hypothetical protein
MDLMTGKQKRKLNKRTRIAAVRATQDAWIADVMSIEAGTRRERDTLFSLARSIREKAQ